MKTIAIIQARINSTRLRGKSMADLCGMPVLGWTVRAATEAELVDEIWVATPDQEIYTWAADNEVDVYLGSEDDVLSRFTAIAEQTKPDLIVRLTADCPFLDPKLIDAAVKIEGATTEFWPDGMDVQVFRPDRLEDGDKEHVVNFWQKQVWAPFNLRMLRVCIDTKRDLDWAREIAARLPKDRAPYWRETLNALREVKAAA